VPRAIIGRVTPVPAQSFFHFRRITLNPAINGGMIDIHTTLGQQLTLADAVPAYRPQDDVTLKMTASGWVHVLLRQQRGTLSLSTSDFCNSANTKSIS